MGPPEGKSLKIDTVSQNRLNAIKKIMKFDENFKTLVQESKKLPLGISPPR